MTETSREKEISVYLLRHADAVPHGTSGVAEDDRPLTPDGKVKMRRGAAGLKKLVPAFDAVLSSPLKRAWQTATIVADVYRHKELLRPARSLLPGGSFPELLSAIEGFDHESKVLLVGHQPSLGEFVSYLVWKKPRELPLKKGGLARVDLEISARRRRAELAWLLAPKHLRLIGGF